MNNNIKSFRPASKQEQLYTYAQSHEINMKTVCIGRLRGDFDSGGEGFYTTWEDRYPDPGRKTQAFKDEFDSIVNALREDPDYHGILKNRRSMTDYCQTCPESAMRGNYTTEYAFRIDTDGYAYVMRLNPTRGDYNFYIFCFEKKWLDTHLSNASKGIRFVTSRYEEKFRIPDGDKIRKLYSDGKVIDDTVRYIDDYHIEMGYPGTIYHICQFAEMMEANGTKVIPLRSSLPDQCYTTLASTGAIIIVKKGEDGYYPADMPDKGREENRRVVDECNAAGHVTKAQEAAMSAGSMFGWAVPAANPAAYDENGVLRKGE